MHNIFDINLAEFYDVCVASGCLIYTKKEENTKFRIQIVKYYLLKNIGFISKFSAHEVINFSLHLVLTVCTLYFQIVELLAFLWQTNVDYNPPKTPVKLILYILNIVLNLEGTVCKGI